MQNRLSNRRPALKQVEAEISQFMQQLNQYELGKQYIAPYLSEKVMDFKADIQQEEAERAKFQMDIGILDAIAQLKKQLEIKDREYIEAFTAHQTELSRVRAELDLIHDKISEAQREAVLESLKKLVDFEVLYSDIQDQEDKIDRAVQSLGCCARIFSCNTQHIEKMQARLDRLKRDRQALGSGNYESFRQALTRHLEGQRKKLQKKYDKLIDRAPKKETDELSNEIARLEGSVEEYWFLHTHYLKPKAMLELITFHDTIHDLRKNVLSRLDVTLQQAGDGIYKQLKSVKKLLKKFEQALLTLFKDFFCVDKENSDHAIEFNVYHKRYQALSRHDRQRLRKSPDLQDEAVQGVFKEEVYGMPQSLGLKMGA